MVLATAEFKAVATHPTIGVILENDEGWFRKGDRHEERLRIGNEGQAAY